MQAHQHTTGCDRKNSQTPPSVAIQLLKGRGSVNAPDWLASFSGEASSATFKNVAVAEAAHSKKYTAWSSASIWVLTSALLPGAHTPKPAASRVVAVCSTCNKIRQTSGDHNPPDHATNNCSHQQRITTHHLHKASGQDQVVRWPHILHGPQQLMGIV